MAAQTVSEFSLPDVQASVMGVDCTGRYVLLCGRDSSLVVDLDSPYEYAVLETHDSGRDPTVLEWHRTDPSRVAVAHNNVCDILSWSANESRLSPLVTLRGYIRPISGLDWCPNQPNLLATSSLENFRATCIWDLRDTSRPVRTTESLSPSCLVRWNPLHDFKYVTGHDCMLQFWDLRFEVAERHFSAHPSRILDFDWSPRHGSEFVLATRDAQVRVWDTGDFGSPMLSASFKKIPMSRLRYSPQGAGIVSRPVRKHWSDAGLLLWRANTLTPLRILPEEPNSLYETEDHSQTAISDDSYVFAFGWCQAPSTAADFFPLQFDSKDQKSEPLRSHLISWSSDRQLRVHSLPASFLRVDDLSPTGIPRDLSKVLPVCPPSSLFPTASSAEATTKPADNVGRSTPPESTNKPSAAPPPPPSTAFSKPPAPTPGRSTPSGSQASKNLDAAAQVLAREISLLSPRAGLYKLEEVDYINRRTKMTLFYCRLAHYHHFGVCRLAVDPTDPRHFPGVVIDSVDLGTLLQTPPPPNSTAPSQSGEASLGVSSPTADGPEPGMVPCSGQVTIVTSFPPGYSSPGSPPTFTIVASSPPLHPALQAHVLHEMQRTAIESVSASRGCIEPCIRRAIQFLNTSDFSALENPSIPRVIVGEVNSSDGGGGGVSLSGTLPLLAKSKDPPLTPTPLSATGPLTAELASFPACDASVPFPRTSGARISPCGILVAFGLHQPLTEILANSPPPPAVTPTPRPGRGGSSKLQSPRSYREFRILMEGRTRYFRRASRSRPPSRHRLRREGGGDLQPPQDLIGEGAGAPWGQAKQGLGALRRRTSFSTSRSVGEWVKRSLSAESLVEQRHRKEKQRVVADPDGGQGVPAPTPGLGQEDPVAGANDPPRNRSSSSLRSFTQQPQCSYSHTMEVQQSDTEGDVSSQQEPMDGNSRKSSDAPRPFVSSTGARRITFAADELDPSDSVAAHSKVVPPALETDRGPRRRSTDGRFVPAPGGGSPKVLLYDISVLLPSSKFLANNYSFDIANVSNMCAHNLALATSTGRPDLIQFWTCCSSLANSQLRQAPFPSIVPPWAVQSMGRPLFNVWASHFLKVKDAQSLTMLGLVMGALDAQSTPPAILLTLPSPPPDQPPQMRQSLRLQLSVGFPPRSRSTVLPPNLTLLEHHLKDRFRASADATDNCNPPQLNDSWSGRSNTPQILGWKGQAPAGGGSGLLDTRESSADQGSTPQPGRRLTLASKVLPARARAAAGLLSSIAPALCEAGDSGMRRTRSSSYCDPAAAWPAAASAATTATTVATTIQSGGSPHIETTNVAEPHTDSLKPPTNAGEDFPVVWSDAVMPRRTWTRSDPSDERLLLGFATTAAEYLSGQVLISTDPAPPEPPVQENYAMQSWLMSDKHLLHFTHFVGSYVELLSSWGLIHCRTRLSLQWHKILLWMSARSKPDFYSRLVDSKEAPASAAANARRLLISPLEWTYGKPPEAIYSWTSLQLTAVAILYPPDLAATAMGSVGESPAREHARLLPAGLDPIEEREVQPQPQCEGTSAAPDGYGPAVLLRCAICRVVVRGIVILCPACHHGGHFEHMFQWYESCLAGQRKFNCPSVNCGCLCAALGNILGKHTGPLRPEMSALRQFRVHRDSV